MKRSGEAKGGLRPPAQTLEAAVADAIKAHLKTSGAALLSAGTPSFEELEVRRACLARITKANTSRLLEMAERVEIEPGRLRIIVALQGEAWEGLDTIEITAPFTHQRKGVERKIVLGDPCPSPDEKLQRTLGRALDWKDRILGGERVEALAKDEGISSRFLRDRLQLAFLSPRIMKAILDGTQPAHLSTNTFVRSDIPLCWSEQESLFGFDQETRLA
ncbi:hypothetical protein NHF45_10350 [Maricaulaceae bacterium NA33B04]|nr:hypothetical protein [Maricaulaceae bacterium NA33B04]